MPQRSMALNAMVEGSLMAALAVVLALMGLYLPPVQLLSNIVWPIPIAVLVARHGLRIGFYATAVTGILLLMLADPIRSFFLLIQFGGLGLLYGYCQNQAVSAGKTVFAGIVVAIVATGIVLSLTLLVMGVDFVQWQQQLELTYNEAWKMYQQLGILERLEQQGVEQETIKAQLASAINLLKTLLPGIMIVGSMVLAGITYIITREVMRRLNLAVVPLSPFTQWQLPWHLSWIVIGGLALVLAGDYWKITLVSNIGKNMIYIYFPVALLSGISVLVYYYKKIAVSMLLKLLLVMILVLNFPFAMLLTILIGVFDPLFNYRRLPKEK